MYEVSLENGLGPIKFGFRPNQVKSMLGSELHYEEWMGGNLENFLFYKGLLIGFKGEIESSPSEDSFVCMFQVKTTHPLYIWGKEITRATKPEISKMLAQQNIKFAMLTNGNFESEDGKLQFNFDGAGVLDEVYFAN